MESEGESVAPEEIATQEYTVASETAGATDEERGSDPSQREPSMTSKINSYFGNQEGRSLGRNRITLFKRKTGENGSKTEELAELPKKKREEVKIEEETLKDVVDKLKQIKSKSQVVTSITVHSIR